MKDKKTKSIRMIRVKTRKKRVMCLWLLLFSSLSFAIYKHFTAIDKHTIRETTVIEKELVDTSGIQSFVEQFAFEFFSWGHSPEEILERQERLEHYLTVELQRLNAEMMVNDVSIPSQVRQVQIWNVWEFTEKHYEVVFTVEQRLEEEEEQHDLLATYQVVVHVDEEGHMVITRNPTPTEKPQRSKYEPEWLTSDGTVTGRQMEEITEFLETFFGLYPSMSERELTQFVSEQALKPIKRDWVFSELVHPVFRQLEGSEKIEVFVSVKYLCEDTKTIQLSQFELILEQNEHENWVIVG